uniref:TIL domain-containing protein n=1 Tax=Caenorhabditis tropicalis TaxID=1561998 RepID=A0A1I7TYI8_9PELO
MKFLKVFIPILLIATVLAAPSKKCGENEEFLSCGTACEANCVDGHVVCSIHALLIEVLVFQMFCTMQCIVDVCQCKQGFFRNKSKKCVPRNKC